MILKKTEAYLFNVFPILLDGPLGAVQAFAMIPQRDYHALEEITLAIATHGYTSSVHSILNWGQKMAELGTPALLFNLPGHYLGGHFDISSFATFSQHAEEYFLLALQSLKNALKAPSHTKIAPLFLGHSLGALLALKAQARSDFQAQEGACVAVGFGKGAIEGKHLFQTPLFFHTLAFRRQLVAPELAPEVMFDWIAEEKEKIKLRGRLIFLLSGLDDAVIGKTGPEVLAADLHEKGNDIYLLRPQRLPHDSPEAAAPYLKDIIRALPHNLQSLKEWKHFAI
jgi:hypothetical protein